MSCSCSLLEYVLTIPPCGIIRRVVERIAAATLGKRLVMGKLREDDVWLSVSRR
jgi:hypothetical protein